MEQVAVEEYAKQISVLVMIKRYVRSVFKLPVLATINVCLLMEICKELAVRKQICVFLITCSRNTVHLFKGMKEANVIPNLIVHSI